MSIAKAIGYSVAGIFTVVAGVELFKALSKPFPEFAAAFALKEGDTVQIPIEKVSVSLPQQAFPGQPTDVDALHAAQANAPGTLITIRNVHLLGEQPGSFDNSSAQGMSDVFPSMLQFKRADVKAIQRDGKPVKF